MRAGAASDDERGRYNLRQRYAGGVSSSGPQISGGYYSGMTPSGRLWETIAMPDLTLIAAVAIFIATYAVVAVGKLPVYRIDRAGAALLGGSLMVGTGVLTAQDAYRAKRITKSFQIG
jgi:hypothetical protein